MKFDVGVPSGAIKHFESWIGDGRLHDFEVAAAASYFGHFDEVGTDVQT